MASEVDHEAAIAFVCVSFSDIDHACFFIAVAMDDEECAFGLIDICLFEIGIDHPEVESGFGVGDVNAVVLVDAVPSLKIAIEKNWNVRTAPELFCFGLLEEFDIPQLRALVGEHRIESSELVQ